MNWIKQHPYFFAFAVSLAIHASALAFFGTASHEKPQTRSFQLRLEDAPELPNLPIKKIEEASSSSVSSEKSGGETVKKAPAPVSANQLLGDPQVGKVFSQYFKDIKQSIASASMEYSEKPELSGEITIYFVLNSNGTVYDVNVINKSSASDALIRSAIRIIREAEQTFRPMPPEIRHDRVVFQVTLEFN